MEDIINCAKECYSIYGFYPISFSFCHKIDYHFPKKEKLLGIIIPGDRNTYIFYDETTYYNDYKKSKFGLTKCRGGWDCNRHLEIMANHCLPLFEDAENIPKYTMIHHPKQLYIEINKRKDELETNEELYKEYLYKITKHFNEFLTGEGMVDYILKITNNEHVKRVLFIDSKMCDRFTDYLSMMIHNAFKMKFKQDCDVYSPVNNRFLYQDGCFDRYHMYGLGFTYAGKIPPVYRSEYEKTNRYDENYLLNNIKNRAYDLIVYGSFYYSTALLDTVKQYYNKNEILGFHGGDNYIYGEEIKDGVDNMTTFVREPGRIRVWIDKSKSTYTCYQDEFSKKN